MNTSAAMVPTADKKNGLYKTLIYVVVTIYIFTSLYIFTSKAVSGDLVGGLPALAGLAFLLLPPAIRSWLKIDLQRDAVLVLYLFIYLAYVLGVAWRWYHTFQYYDKFVHTLAGLFFCMIGLGLFYILKPGHAVEPEKDVSHAVTYSIFFSVSIGVMWEAWEYCSDRIFKQDTQRVITSGVHDTMQDLLVCALGAGIFAIFIYRYLRYRKRSFLLAIFENFLSEIAHKNSFAPHEDSAVLPAAEITEAAYQESVHSNAGPK